MSDTPRTDALLTNLSDYQTRDPVGALVRLAQDLERELADLEALFRATLGNLGTAS